MYLSSLIFLDFVIPLVNEETGEVVMRSDGSGRPVMVRRFRTAYNEVARKTQINPVIGYRPVYDGGR